MVGPYYQKSLLPLELIELSANGSGSADLTCIGTASNGKDYAIKHVNDGKGHIPVSEVFCYELASELNIPTPEYQFIKMDDGTIAFGSVWEGGAKTLTGDTEIFELLSGDKKIRGLNSFLSKVYAMDVFVSNIDRHFGNYLFRPSYSATIPIAFDYSRAWYAHSPYCQHTTIDCIDPHCNAAMESKCNTQNTIKWIRQYKLFEPQTAISTLDKIGTISADRIKGILNSLPDKWIDSKRAGEVVSWWGKREMMNRIKHLKTGM